MALSAVLTVVLLIVSFPLGLPGELLLQSLRFHLIAVGLVLALAAILSGARWRGLIVLLVVLASAAHGAKFLRDYYVRQVPMIAEPLAEFKFLSFNVLTGNTKAAELVDAVLADPPDVMLVMETPGIERYLDRLTETFPYRVGCSQTLTCDISLHSRFPIADPQIRLLPPFGHERMVTGRVEINGQAITIAGVHLSKPYFDRASWIELGNINRALNLIEGPLVLAGDFNAAPWTAPVARLAWQQTLMAGPWAPATWPVRLGPLGVPIDNVFTRGNVRLLTLEAGDNHGSNHRPLWADVAIYAEP